MNVDNIRKEAERAKRSAECAERLEYLLGELDERDAKIAELEQQHERDMQLLEQATRPNIKSASVKRTASRRLVEKRSGRWSHLKWTVVHSMREDFVLNGMTIHSISQKYGISFDTVKAIVHNTSKKWYLQQYQDVLIERGLANA